MKANNGKGNNPLRDGWRTPSEIFEPLDQQYGFTYDCCSNGKDNKCQSWTSDFEMYADGGMIEQIYWMNPPFSIAWRMFEQFFKVVKKGVAIYRCDNLETGLWQKVILPNCDWVFIPNRRISYEGLDGDGARFPSALIGVGVPPIESLAGITLRPSGRLTHEYEARTGSPKSVDFSYPQDVSGNDASREFVCQKCRRAIPPSIDSKGNFISKCVCGWNCWVEKEDTTGITTSNTRIGGE